MKRPLVNLYDIAGIFMIAAGLALFLAVAGGGTFQIALLFVIIMFGALFFAKRG